MANQWRQGRVPLALLVLLAAGCGGLSAEPTPTAPAATAVPATPTSIRAMPTPMARLDGKQALIVIYERFEDSEYGVPRAILEDLGVVFTVGSLTTEVVRGMAGTEVAPDAHLADVHGSDYDAVMFVGGMGYQVDDPEGQRIAREAVAEDRVVAAICVAPLTLAEAGVVNGKRVTTATEPDVMEEARAIVTFTGVERDGNIITANSPGGARRFGETIAAALGE